MQLTKGIFYDFVLEYCEYFYDARIYLKWSAQDIALEIIPSEYFFQQVPFQLKTYSVSVRDNPPSESTIESSTPKIIIGGQP